jgi:uncharacterized hydrophobic protein (TIGR00271 family)
MLSVRVTAPRPLAERLRADLADDASVCDLAVLAGAAEHGHGDVLLFEMARENANAIMSRLREAGVAESGSVVVSEPIAVLSDAAVRAERAAPGHPADGVLWAQLSDRSREDARPSATFFTFLLLATLIAGIGRLLDQPILIIGAMVVGPEFAPIAAICWAFVRRKGHVARTAAATLAIGFVGCTLASWLVWWVVYRTGVFTFEQATTGPLTQFIVSPDAWSFVIAVLAGIAGVLSVTGAKSSALVGVFISITTVPAIGTLGLTLAVGAWDEAAASALQLAINVAGLLLAGTATLAVQLSVGRRIRARRAARAARKT